MSTTNRVDLDEQNEDAYDELIVSIEASEGTLSLLIAACDDNRLRDEIIDRYEAELAPDIRNYRLPIMRGEPSLTQTIRAKVQDDEYLRNGGRAVVTITGAEQLFFLKLGEERSEQEIFFGYLQWTREALREFHFPIVLWVTHQLLGQLARHAPDFWSWRKGVFRFTSRKSGAVRSSEIEAIRPALEGFDLPADDDYLLPLKDLRELIAQTEDRQPNNLLLATLYNQMGQIHVRRLDRGEAQDHHQEVGEALHYFRKAADLQRKLDQKIDLAGSLAWLGYLFYSQERYREAEPMFIEALALSQHFLGNDHPNVVDSLNNLAILYTAQKHYDEAESLFMQALELRRRLLLEGEDRYFPQLEERINNLEEFLDIPTTKKALSEFEGIVLRIKTLIDIQSVRASKGFISRVLKGFANSLDEKDLNKYRDLITFLEIHIITWEEEMTAYERELKESPIRTDKLLEARDQIRRFIVDLSEYTRLVQKIYRNLLEIVD